jgi:hypothetical protein
MEPATGTGKPKSCTYETAEGLCGQPVKARGLCLKHYKVMARAGAFRDPAALGREVARTENLSRLQEARRLLEERAPGFSKDIIRAARVSSKRGELRALLELVQLLRVVEPLPKEEATGQKVTVQIGVALPHLPVPAQVQVAAGSPAGESPRTLVGEVAETPAGKGNGVGTEAA